MRELDDIDPEAVVPQFVGWSGCEATGNREPRLGPLLCSGCRFPGGLNAPSLQRLDRGPPRLLPLSFSGSAEWTGHRSLWP